MTRNDAFNASLAILGGLLLRWSFGLPWARLRKIGV
jgi:hypothetical protein